LLTFAYLLANQSANYPRQSSRPEGGPHRRDTAAEPDDNEDMEQVETDSWNNEQVHGGNVRRVVTQEGSPSLAGGRPSFDHVLGDARLRGSPGK
jgi:hypothetical protein